MDSANNIIQNITKLTQIKEYQSTNTKNSLTIPIRPKKKNMLKTNKNQY